jgi:hypothetical protein
MTLQTRNPGDEAGAPKNIAIDSAISFYPTPAFISTSGIEPWEHVTVGLQLAVAKISRAYLLSDQLARVIAEHSGLGGRHQ